MSGFRARAPGVRLRIVSRGFVGVWPTKSVWWANLSADSLNAVMEASRAHLSETVTTDSDGLHVDLSPAQLAQAGVDPGKPAVIEVRPYTAQDWERDNAGRIYESTDEMDAALDEYCALPDAESA
jgi:hypothetical protein